MDYGPPIKVPGADLSGPNHTTFYCAKCVRMCTPFETGTQAQTSKCGRCNGPTKSWAGSLDELKKYYEIKKSG